jgi:hypothetical protein
MGTGDSTAEVRTRASAACPRRTGTPSCYVLEPGRRWMSVLLFGIFLTESALTQECARFRDASSEELVRYLSVTTPNVATTDCVTFAIVAMGQRRYRPAICVLVKLLDFHLLPPPAEDMLFETSGPRYYPATAALMEIGRSSLPYLMRAMRSNSTSPIARKNAVAVFMYLNGSNPAKGIASLKQEEDRAAHLSAKQNLAAAPFTAMHCCAPDHKRICEAAAKTGTAPEQRRSR